MSNTNLSLGSNWEPGEWPEHVSVSHEGLGDEMCYVPSRTCHPESPERVDYQGRLHLMFHRCSECGHDLPYEAEKGHCNYCPSCGARVVER